MTATNTSLEPAMQAAVKARSRYSTGDTVLLKLAREIAMDIRPLDNILETHQVTRDEWEGIRDLPSFQDYLRRCREEWQSATNTSERVKLKSLAFVEESLEEFFARAHDPRESLAQKTDILKTVAKFAGVGAGAEGTVSGERFSVTINLGSDQKLHIEKDVTPAEVFDKNYTGDLDLDPSPVWDTLDLEEEDAL